MSETEQRPGHALRIADLIRRFATGQVGPYEWDDVMGIPFDDVRLERVRLKCEKLLTEGTMDDLLAVADEVERNFGISSQ
jgi:hypothetical protein